MRTLDRAHDGVIRRVDVIHPRQLDETQWKLVVRDAPLVSIDIVVRDRAGRVLLGIRRNAPAKGYWFVPGGRIVKDESLDDAFLRITSAEINLPLARRDAAFLGVYEHFYADNVFGESGFGTHYVAMGYEVSVPAALDDLPLAQQDEYRWWPTTELLGSDRVHPNTKEFFQAPP